MIPTYKKEKFFLNSLDNVWLFSPSNVYAFGLVGPTPEKVGKDVKHGRQLVSGKKNFEISICGS